MASHEGKRESQVPLLDVGGPDDDDAAQGGVYACLCGKDVSANKVDKMWNDNQHLFNDEHARVNFIKYVNVRFAPDGGFGDIPNLWNADNSGVSLRSRCFTAILAVIFVFYNTVFLLTDNIRTLMSSTADNQDFFLCRHLIDVARRGVAFPPWLDAVLTNNAKLIALMELAGLVILWSRVLSDLVIHFCPRLHLSMCGADESKIERAQWFADIRLYWVDLQKIGSYSGMRLLNYIQPPVISVDISNIMAMKPSHKCLAWTHFILMRIFCLLVGFDMFLKKFRDADLAGVFSMDQDDVWTWTQVLRSFLFMRQVMAVVHADVLVRERLFLFVFGGEESKLDLKEKTIQYVWEALIARRIYRTCKEEHGGNKFMGYMQYAAVMTSFTDNDFQHLILDPRKEQ